MKWEVKYLPEVLEDLRRLDGSQRILVLKAIEKVRENPLPDTEGGYGKPLGSRNASNLSGFLKIKIAGRPDCGLSTSWCAGREKWLLICNRRPG